MTELQESKKLESPVRQIKVALDGTGGDCKEESAKVESIRLAFHLCPELHLLVFGSTELQDLLAHSDIPETAYTFYVAEKTIEQDASPINVLRHEADSAMCRAMQAVKAGLADAMISSGGSGPLVCLARYIFGVQHFSEQQCALRAELGLKVRGGRVRPCFAARIPVGVNRCALMLDLGANASSSPADLYDFAHLGHAVAPLMLDTVYPRIALLNVGVEQGKGNALVQKARTVIMRDAQLNFKGFIEANRLFRDDADIIVTDGFTGNVALKAAEGVADIFTSSVGFKRFLARMSRPDWLQPWQYNGSVLLGVNGIVVKSHGSAGAEAVAVAIVEAARSAQVHLAEQVQARLLAM